MTPIHHCQVTCLRFSRSEVDCGWRSTIYNVESEHSSPKQYNYVWQCVGYCPRNRSTFYTAGCTRRLPASLWHGNIQLDNCYAVYFTKHWKSGHVRPSSIVLFVTRSLLFWMRNKSFHYLKINHSGNISS